MKLKIGLKVKGVQPELLLGLLVADSVHRDLVDDGIVVTELTGGKHKPNSLHYKGQAADIRTHHLSEKRRNLFNNALKDALGADYDVIIEFPGKPEEHMHLEFDPK